MFPADLPGGTTHEGLIYNVNLITTVMNRVGITAAEVPLDGIDIRPMISGGHGGRPYVTSAFRDFAFVRRGTHVLIAHFKGGRQQLFDLSSDPACERNVASDHKDLFSELWCLALKDAGGELPVYEGHTTFADGQQDEEQADY